MSQIKEATAVNLDQAQAIKLSLLVDLEAGWENLRKTPTSETDKADTRQDLQGRQKAYEVFRAKLAAYNQAHTPGHVPEVLLNTPVRLGIWCRKMRDLFQLVEHDPRAHCPVYLLEKAYRWADRISARMSTDRISRSPAPTDLRAAIHELEAVGQWCERLASLTRPE